MTDIRVYGVSPIPVRDHLVVIVVWSASSERRTFCEVFVVSSDALGRVDGQRFMLPADAFSGESESARQIFLEGEATRWAIRTIENDLLTWIRGQPDGVAFPPNVHLQSAGEHALRRLWVSGRLRTWIDYLQTATLSEVAPEF